MSVTENNEPSVSIVVSCRNERDTLLQAILFQGPPTGDFKVIVADGMSNDGTQKVLMY